MTDSAKLPKIVILGTGGTIVSSGNDPLMLTGYRIKGLNVETLLCAVPELQYFARIEAHQIANIDSSSMTFSIWLELGRAIEKAAADPDTAGIVVTHGTDTMEETAWFTHLTAKTQKPIVFTGAMRPATALSADGPLNLLNAVRIAADPKAAGRGVLVALNDVILSARDAMKISPTNAAAFGPNVQGPLGLIAGAEILWLGRPERAFGSETPFSIPKLAALEIPRVDIVYSHADDDGVMVRAACDAGARAIVHAGTGNGSIHCCTDEALADVLRDVLDTPVSPELLPPKDGVIAQKTEELVGPYELHDFFLYHLMRYGSEPKKIYRLAKYAFAEDYDEATILKWLHTFYRRFFAQQFKRSCLPDGPKVGTVSLSPRGDLRMPSDACAELWLEQIASLYK